MYADVKRGLKKCLYIYRRDRKYKKGIGDVAGKKHQENQSATVN